MASSKKKIEEIEIEEEEKVVESIIEEDKMSLYNEYFSAGLDLDGLAYPKNYYDVIVFNARDNERYYYGTAAAHAFDALKSNGHFIFNSNGSAHIMDQVIEIIKLFFVYVPEQSKDGYYVFTKKE